MTMTLADYRRDLNLHRGVASTKFTSAGRTYRDPPR
jgi:hypothetical protein